MSKDTLIKLCSTLSRDNAKVFLRNFKILSLELNFNAADYLQESKFGTTLFVDKLQDSHVVVMLSWFK